MILPDFITADFETNVGAIQTAEFVTGGDINQGAKITTKNDLTFFVKWHENAPPNMFAAEAYGLTLLADTNTLHIPECVYQNEHCLILMWLEMGERQSQIVAQVLGEGLAYLHQSGASQYGLDQNNFCGLTLQINTWHDNWVDFFINCRLQPQISLAERYNRLSISRGKKLNHLLKQLPNLLPANPPISLLHGDLWGGNWIVTKNGQPALIDPAVYYGHREADLAFTELFGGFSSQFYQAYQTIWPLEAGYEERKRIYNLYHLLNHLNLFGEGYGGSVDGVLNRFV
ncbi:MAG: fructosamine kinase family protein [Chloroflexota bacterium]